MPLGNYGGVDEPYDNSWPFPKSKPGDMFPMAADLTIYWPYVAKCWEEANHIVRSNGRQEMALLPEFYERKDKYV